MVGANLTKVYCKHIWRCYNEPPQYNLYMLIKMWKKIGSVSYWEPFSRLYLRMSWWERKGLDRFLLSDNSYLFIFCTWHYFEGIEEQQKQHLARMTTYQLTLITLRLSPLITYYVIWIYCRVIDKMLCI
jgi:hypothetical protein